jgi:hypothetical protein
MRSPRLHRPRRRSAQKPAAGGQTSSAPRPRAVTGFTSTMPPWPMQSLSAASRHPDHSARLGVSAQIILPARSHQPREVVGEFR